MQTQSKTAAAADLARFFDTPANYEHANTVADLVLEQLPNGEYAWLRPSPEPSEDDDALYVITETGRRALRMAELFGTDA